MRGLERRQLVGLAALAALALLAGLLRLLVGRDVATNTMEFAWPAPSYATFRWTALSAGVIIGASLALSGLLLQALLRNPLAEPFILGLSSGAGLGVMLALYIAYRLHDPGAEAGGSSGSEGALARNAAAVGGALAALAVVYALGQRRGWLDPVSLVLVGVIIAAVCGAGIMLLQHLVDTGLRNEFTLWLMGHIPEGVSVRALAIAGTIAALGFVVSVMLGRAMDAATLGDVEARSVGLAIGPLRLAMFVLAGVLAAATVALAGPIGFVGLIAPHAARLVLGPRHGLLAIGATLAGIALVVGSDVARQAIDLGAGRMPIGVFTALIGGPAFIWLLLSGRAQA